MSGVGFDVVPTDCMARYVSEKLPGATRLEIAIAGLGQLSAGTAKSMFDGMLVGGQARREGALVSEPIGRDTRRIRFSDRERSAIAIPWGDLETAYRTTGIPNITTYMAFPKRLAAAARSTWRLQDAAAPLTRKLLGAAPIKGAIVRLLEKRIAGPDAQARARSAEFAGLGLGLDASGRSVEAWLETLDGYSFTAVAGVRSVEKILAKPLAGALTPALAFGADFPLEIEGTRRFDALPT